MPMAPISNYVSLGFSHFHTTRYLENNGSQPELHVSITWVALKKKKNSEAQDPSPKILICNGFDNHSHRLWEGLETRKGTELIREVAKPNSFHFSPN